VWEPRWAIRVKYIRMRNPRAAGAVAFSHSQRHRLFEQYLRSGSGGGSPTGSAGSCRPDPIRVRPHQWQRAQCSVAHCGRPRATSATPTCQHKRKYVQEGVKTPSTVHQVGGSYNTSPPKRRRHDGAVLCSALLCSDTPPALCIRIAQNSSQLQNSKTSFSSIALACVFSHAPRPMLVSRGRSRGSCTSCRLSAA
jgi:hypothetical protein